MSEETQTEITASENRTWLTAHVGSAAGDETPGHPQSAERPRWRDAKSTLADDGTEATRGSDTEVVTARYPRVRASIHDRAAALITAFRRVIEPIATCDPVEYANRISAFLDDAERFMQSARLQGTSTYFDFATMLQLAALQWEARPGRWREPNLTEVPGALQRLSRMNPIVQDDIAALLRALSADGIRLFEPLD